MGNTAHLTRGTLMAASGEAYGSDHPATFTNPKNNPKPGHFYEGSEEAGNARGKVWVDDKPAPQVDDSPGGRWDG